MNPEEKVPEGKKIYYMYSKPVLGQPRVTLAAYEGSKKKMEIYYAVVITDTRDIFIKRKGRIKAMGRAVSTNRRILRVSSFEPKKVKERLSKIVQMEFLQAVERQEVVREKLAERAVQEKLQSKKVKVNYK